MPDGYTLIPGASATARYDAVGNSLAVPVVKWLG
jgi:DNA (cytosine-5)-methyltransferase 1